MSRTNLFLAVACVLTLSASAALAQQRGGTGNSMMGGGMGMGGGMSSMMGGGGMGMSGMSGLGMGGMSSGMGGMGMGGMGMGGMGMGGMGGGMGGFGTSGMGGIGMGQSGMGMNQQGGQGLHRSRQRRHDLDLQSSSAATRISSCNSSIARWAAAIAAAATPHKNRTWCCPSVCGSTSPSIERRSQPTAVATTVRGRLEKLLTRRNIAAPDVEIVGDTVVLRGVAASESQRLVIEKLVMLEPGVMGVDNQMTVAQSATPLSPPLPPQADN